MWDRQFPIMKGKTNAINIFYCIIYLEDEIVLNELDHLKKRIIKRGVGKYKSTFVIKRVNLHI